MRARSMQNRARKITIIVVVHLRPQQGVTARSDGVPNVADEEPGVCFGKIHARTAATRNVSRSTSSGGFTKSKTNVEKG